MNVKDYQMYKPRVGVHEVIEKLFEAIGRKEAGSPQAGVEIVAKFLGVGKTTAYKWADHDQDGEISYQRVRLLTEYFGVNVAASDLSRIADGEFVARDVKPSNIPWPAKMIAFGRCVGDVQGEMWEALADGVIDRSEAPAILTAIREAKEHLCRMEARVEQVLKEKASVVPMKGAAR